MGTRLGGLTSVQTMPQKGQGTMGAGGRQCVMYSKTGTAPRPVPLSLSLFLFSFPLFFSSWFCSVEVKQEGKRFGSVEREAQIIPSMLAKRPSVLGPLTFVPTSRQSYFLAADALENPPLVMGPLLCCLRFTV